MDIKKVGVVGCGVMGSGITQVCATAGYQVVALEVNEVLLNKGLLTISASLAIDVKRRRITQEAMDSIMSRIKGTTALSDFADCDLVIEAVAENLSLKKGVFMDLDQFCLRRSILATNTSCLPVSELAMVTTRPDRVLGLHFFNPVPMMKLLEVVKTNFVGDDALKTAEEFGRSIGKTTIIAPDTPGFVVNRLLMPFMLGAFRMVEAGLATKEGIDEGARLGLGHPMGPLKLADLVGIDTVLYIAGAIYERLKDPLYEPPRILKEMVSQGYLGRKSGKGFYEYRQ